MSSALLVIDFQIAITQGQLPHDFDGVLSRIEALIAKAKAQRVPVIWVQHQQAGSLFERGLPTWRFVERVAPDVGDLVIHKQSSDAFHHTKLHEWLGVWGIKHLVVCGYASEFCLDTSVRAAASHDYAVTVVQDAHTTKDRPTLTAEQIKSHLNWFWPHLSVANAQGQPNPIELLPADQVVFSKSAQTQAEFSALHEAQGYAPTVLRSWQPNETAPLHSHNFEFSALLVEGEFWLEVDGETGHESGPKSRKFLPGERYTLPLNQPHAELYGPQGASYWVSRREPLIQKQ